MKLLKTLGFSMHKAERGLFDLTRGQPLCLTDPDGQGPARRVLVAPVESLQASTLDWLRSLAIDPLRLVLTRSRIQAMGLPTHGSCREASDALQNGRRNGDARADALSLGLSGNATAGRILRLSTAVGKVRRGSVDLRPASPREAAALRLARVGRLLPAVVCAEIEDPGADATLGNELLKGGVMEISTSEIDRVSGAEGLGVVRITEAPVPLEEAEDARVVLFREAGGLFEHVAILIGRPEEWPDPVPARLHSACLTGDLFGSLKCDCGEQLRGSLRAFVSKGGGVLLYLAQEGRGIGLGNKLRAYALQEEGLDTIDADCTLGFGADERRYEPAVGMLKDLGVRRVQLLTNNPDKVEALKNGGIEVAEREPLHGTLNPHNLPYVRAKVHRAGHWLEEMLAGKTANGVGPTDEPS